MQVHMHEHKCQLSKYDIRILFRFIFHISSRVYIRMYSYTHTYACFISIECLIFKHTITYVSLKTMKLKSKSDFS